MNAAVQVTDASKRFGKVQALAGLTLDVQAGEAFCLLGPNGAGKSTALNLMLGLSSCDGGAVQVFGHDPSSKSARALVGYAAQDNDFPPFLKVREIVNLVRGHYKAPLSEQELLDGFGLAELAGRYTGGFSGGQRRRLSLALAFAGRPKLVFLDEPTVGLDAKSRNSFWSYTKEFVASGGTAVVTTHHIDEIETIADRICLINKGQNQLSGTVQDIKASLDQKLVTLRCANPPALPFVLSLQQDGDRMTLNTSDADGLVRHLVQSGVDFSNLEIRSSTLEEALHAQTRKGT